MAGRPKTRARRQREEESKKLTVEAKELKAEPSNPKVVVADDPAPDAAIEGLREGLALLGKGEDFEFLLRASLDFARTVMSMQIDMAVPAVALKLMTLKKEVMASVLSAGVRLNDATLRKKDEDKVGKLLQQVKAKSQGRVDPAPAEEVTKAELFS